MNPVRWQLDEDGRIVHWTAGAAAFLGLPAAAVLRKPCAEVIGGTDPLAVRCVYAAQYSGKFAMGPTRPVPL